MSVDTIDANPNATATATELRNMADLIDKDAVHVTSLTSTKSADGSIEQLTLTYSCPDPKKPYTTAPMSQMMCGNCNTWNPRNYFRCSNCAMINPEREV